MGCAARSCCQWCGQPVQLLQAQRPTVCLHHHALGIQAALHIRTAAAASMSQHCYSSCRPCMRCERRREGTGMCACQLACCAFHGGAQNKHPAPPRSDMTCAACTLPGVVAQVAQALTPLTDKHAAAGCMDACAWAVCNPWCGVCTVSPTRRTRFVALDGQGCHAVWLVLYLHGPLCPHIGQNEGLIGCTYCMVQAAALTGPAYTSCQWCRLCHALQVRWHCIDCAARPWYAHT